MFDKVSEIKKIISNINLPYCKENVGKVLTSVIERNDIYYVSINGDYNQSTSVSDLHFIKMKIESAISEIFGLKCFCIIESHDPEILSLNGKKGSDISGMFTKIDGVKEVIVVSSGKGGVGKTSIAIMVANTIKAQGYKVGIADLDIYGPSIPAFFDITDRHTFKDGKIVPHNFDGLQIASIGMMVDSKDPLIWRGPMINKAIMQLTRDVAWNDLDYLIIDTPPGTGDVHITLLQKIPINKVFAVSTYDKIALQNTLKNINMFEKMGSKVNLLFLNMFNMFGNHENILPYKERLSAIKCLDIAFKNNIINSFIDDEIL